MREQFYQLCKEIELLIAYRLGVSEEEVKLLDEYFSTKHRYVNSGGISYRWGIERLQELKQKLEEVLA